MNLETNQLAQCDPHSQHKLPKQNRVSYIQLNNTDERYGYEGWKFDIK